MLKIGFCVRVYVGCVARNICETFITFQKNKIN